MRDSISPDEEAEKAGLLSLDDTPSLPSRLRRALIAILPYLAMTRRLLLFLLPSFLQHQSYSYSSSPSPTAYLDGIRGLAALFVFLCHFSYQAFDIAFAYGCEDNNYAPLKLPLLRLFYQGPVAVCVFFVVSGYALSCRACALARRRSWSDFSSSLSSLVFRRGIRLYLPTAISTLLIVVLLRVGAYEATRDFANDRVYMKNVVEPHPARLDSTFAQLADWGLAMFRFVHVFGWERFGGATTYDVHLWTIPVEFRCSLFLFLAIIATARLRTPIRFITVAGLTVFAYLNSRWDLALFFCGMVLAETDYIRREEAIIPNTIITGNDSGERKKSSWWPLLWALLSIIGLYLMSYPDGKGDVTPGWIWLTAAIPDWWADEKFRYWQSVGSVLFVAAVGHSPRWQRLFTSRPIQYLGSISYALYLMHGPVMHVLGYHWERLAYALTGVEGYWYNAGFILSGLLCIPTVFWCADIFWRAVDIPTVRFAKWVEASCLIRD